MQLHYYIFMARGLSRDKLEIRQQIADHLRSGKTPAEVAKLMDCCTSLVHQAAAQAGIQLRRPITHEKVMKALWKMANTTDTLADISHTLDINPSDASKLYRLAKKVGWKLPPRTVGRPRKKQ